jgi:RND family efflux transporter MFP subunit
MKFSLANIYVRIGIGVLVLLVAGSVVAFRKNGANPAGTFTVATTTLSDTVRVAGRVTPVHAVDLGFERSGIVSQVFVKNGDAVGAGQVIATLSNADLAADVAQARAQRDEAQAQLSQLYNSSSDTTTRYPAILQNAQQSLETALVSALGSAQDAIYNDADQFFSNPRSPYPRLTFSGTFLSDLEKERVALGDVLAQWEKRLLKTIDETAVGGYASLMQSDLSRITAFLTDMTTLASQQGTIAGTPPAVVDANTTTLSQGRSEVVSAHAALVTAQQTYQSAQITYSNEDVVAQQSALNAKQAALLSASAQYEKTILRSPITGVVNNKTVDAGESVSAQTPVLSVVSAGNLEVKGNVSELDIGKVRVGDAVAVTLDAYGDGVTFPGHVSEIDPAETFVDGIPVYGITVSFDAPDSRIRSGMTANVSIVTGQKEGVLAVPESFVLADATSSSVFVVGDSGVEKRTVTTGTRGDGFIEILSGLSFGEVIELPASGS